MRLIALGDISRSGPDEHDRSANEVVDQTGAVGLIIVKSPANENLFKLADAVKSGSQTDINTSIEEILKGKESASLAVVGFLALRQSTLLIPSTRDAVIKRFLTNGDGLSIGIRRYLIQSIARGDALRDESQWRLPALSWFFENLPAETDANYIRDVSSAAAILSQVDKITLQQLPPSQLSSMIALIEKVANKHPEEASELPESMKRIQAKLK